MIRNVLAALTDQPLLVREMRTRMRGTRAYWTLFGYLLILVLFVLFTYWGLLIRLNSPTTGHLRAAHEMSNSIFNTTIAVQFFLILFIIPAITSSSIAQEKEQQSLDLLLVTPLSRARIVYGKLLSSTAFVLLMIATSLPIVSICFLFGGVSSLRVATYYIFLISFSLLSSALGLMWSSLTKTSAQAAIFTYLSAIPISIYSFFYVTTYTVAIFVTSNESMLFKFALEYLFIVSIPASLCMNAVTLSRLYAEPADHAGWPRLLFLLLNLLFIVSIAWMLQHWPNLPIVSPFAISSSPLQNNSNVLSTLLQKLFNRFTGIWCAYLLILVPCCATSALYPEDIAKLGFGRYLLSGWTWRGLRRAYPASGTAYVTILTLLAFLTICLCLSWVYGLHNVIDAAFGPSSSFLALLGLTFAYIFGLSFVCLFLSFYVQRIAILAIWLFFGIPWLLPFSGLREAILQLLPSYLIFENLRTLDPNTLLNIATAWVLIGVVSFTLCLLVLRRHRIAQKSDFLTLSEVPHEPTS
ncbi:ABC-2 family transporter protein [Chthonomonas calidirosea]|uniref:ABC-2 family transporter protein n=1 Tax=Chthonomonas calidirosea (strain DSM 23976 / ICMP 18418 / T49) TaxID=1303518 RepID=S0EXX4_CHTCT|nr:ABC transporter permease [Chthonomonas calidirosea]CCW34653.1 ABC-2 family transporter protein [Chthonomonas calidirosea T49]CEK14173.1 ABC-2 family transporter protein [Chthonomonas calidirosea]